MNPKIRTAVIHIGLFAITLFTTTLAGAEWYSLPVDTFWSFFVNGFAYSVPFLFILTVHEFGHYFTAMYHGVKATLPYYIPMPLPPGFFSIGTLGAVIRIKSEVQSKQQHFDIGVAGPLAGFIAALGVLIYAFTHLPPPEYIFQFHPEYKQYGLDYAQHVYSVEYMKQSKSGVIDIMLGKNLLFSFLSDYFGDQVRVPNAHEMMHYPLLLAGYLSLVFTSLNLLPVGQLDGGHVLYGLVGYKWHKRIASVIFIIAILFTGFGFVVPGEPTDVLMWKIPVTIMVIYMALAGLKLPQRDTLMYTLVIFVFLFLAGYFFQGVTGFIGWWPFLLLVGRFVGISHPPSPIEAPLMLGRKITGWLALLIFVLCFTPNPLQIEIVEPPAVPPQEQGVTASR